MKLHRAAKSHPPIGLPRVNLLSASSFAQLATRRMRRRFLVAGACLVVLVGASGTLQYLRVADADRLLSVEQAETARLGADTQALAPVRAFVNDVAFQEQTVKTNMASEIHTSDVLGALHDATPSGLRIETLSLTVAAAPTDSVDGAVEPSAMAPCPGPDPFNTRTVVACITLAGTAGDRAQVGELVIALGEVDLFVEPFISTTTAGDTAGVSFSGSVGLSQAAFSGRFGDPATAAEGSVTP